MCNCKISGASSDVLTLPSFVIAPCFSLIGRSTSVQNQPAKRVMKQVAFSVVAQTTQGICKLLRIQKHKFTQPKVNIKNWYEITILYCLRFLKIDVTTLTYSLITRKYDSIYIIKLQNLSNLNLAIHTL